MAKCKYCGKEFKDRPSKVFCNSKCNVDYHSKQRRIRKKDDIEFQEYHRKKSKEWYQNKKGGKNGKSD